MDHSIKKQILLECQDIEYPISQYIVDGIKRIMGSLLMEQDVVYHI